MIFYIINSRKNSVLYKMLLYYRIVNFLSIGFGFKINNKDYVFEFLVLGLDLLVVILC